MTLQLIHSLRTAQELAVAEAEFGFTGEFRRHLTRVLADPFVGTAAPQVGAIGGFCRRRVKTGPPAPVEIWAT